ATHRYARMIGRLGIRTRLHAIRHYSATELLAPRGRPAHDGGAGSGAAAGGVTTLKVYAASVARADQQASELLATRLPTPRPRIEATALRASLKDRSGPRRSASSPARPDISVTGLASGK